MEQVSGFYSPRTGFGSDYRTSAKFSILHPDNKFPHWSSPARLSQHTVPNSHRVVTQYHGRAPWTITLRLWFPDMANLVSLEGMVGKTSTLRYSAHLSKSVGGYREGIEGVDYLVLENTLLTSLTDELYEIDGACEATATFERLYVEPPVYEEPAWSPPKPPVAVQPSVLFSPLGSRTRYGAITPTLTGSARLSGNSWYLPSIARNYFNNPYFTNNADGSANFGGATVTRVTSYTDIHPTAIQAVCPGAASAEGILTYSGSGLSLAANGQSYIGHFVARGTGTVRAHIAVNFTDSTTVNGAQTIVTLNGTPQKIVTPPVVATAGKTINYFNVFIVTTTKEACTFGVSKLVYERGTAATDTIPELTPTYALQPGNTWSGTANASQGVRDYSSIVYAPPVANRTRGTIALNLKSRLVESQSLAQFAQLFGSGNEININISGANRTVYVNRGDSSFESPVTVTSTNSLPDNLITTIIVKWWPNGMSVYFNGVTTTTTHAAVPETSTSDLVLEGLGQYGGAGYDVTLYGAAIYPRDVTSAEQGIIEGIMADSAITWEEFG